MPTWSIRVSSCTRISWQQDHRCSQEGCTMPGSVIVSGARTPIGKLLGALKGFQAVDLGGMAIESALSRAGITGDQVDYVILGQVLQAGGGGNTGPPGAA